MSTGQHRVGGGKGVSGWREERKGVGPEKHLHQILFPTFGLEAQHGTSQLCANNLAGADSRRLVLYLGQENECPVPLRRLFLVASLAHKNTGGRHFCVAVLLRAGKLKIGLPRSNQVMHYPELLWESWRTYMLSHQLKQDKGENNIQQLIRHKVRFSFTSEFMNTDFFLHNVQIYTKAIWQYKQHQEKGSWL